MCSVITDYNGAYTQLKLSDYLQGLSKFYGTKME